MPRVSRRAIRARSGHDPCFDKETMLRLRIGALPLVWIIIGVIVAWSNDYFQDVNTANQFWSAVLAVIAWPLPLFGADIVVR
jgi:hypothetical protein